MANVNPIPIYPPGLKAPMDYPNTPSVGKVQILFDYNKKDIYHRFSPYTDRGSLIQAGQKQPYIWRYPDEQNKGFGRKLPKWVKNLEKLGIAPTVSGADDVERIGEWLTSGYGIQYTIKQAVLQAYQPFNETAIYNPASPLIATMQPVSFGLIDRPTRFIDQGSVLGALFSALGLKGSFGGLTDSLLGKALGKSPYSSIAPGSVGSGGIFGFRFGSSSSPNPLPNIARDSGKGLMRGKTALQSISKFKSIWGSTGIGESIGNMIRDAIDPLIPNILPRKIDAQYRADEQAYLYMIKDSRGRLSYYTKDKVMVPMTQMWFADTKALQPSSRFDPIYPRVFGREESMYYVYGSSIDGKSTGYSLTGGGSGLLNDLLNGKGLSGRILRGLGQAAKAAVMPYISGVASLIGISLKGKVEVKARKYGDNVGRSTDPYSLENSDMMAKYGNWLSDPTNQDFLSNQFDRTTEKKRVENLKKLLNDVDYGGIYKTDVPSDSLILSSGNSTLAGYQRINAVTKMFQKSNGSSQEYTADSAVRVVDGGISRKNAPDLGMATTNRPDIINQFGVINKKRDVNVGGMETNWNPYTSDLIAFFFYDVVNQKYIPFRATVKGISESGTAMWEEMKFLGRPDMLYSYSGFSRNLSFTFTVHINSITELLPTWKRINYLAGAIKPSNYVNIGNNVYGKFMVPPMFMINIGDLYKYQPCVITSVGVSIPDDASWETLNDENARNGWSYLNGMIKAPSIGKKYAQYPREAEISITCNLLEKEKPIVGNAHFGHAPHTLDYKDNEYIPGSSDNPYYPTPTEFDKGLVEYQEVQTKAGPKRSTPGLSTERVMGENLLSAPKPTTTGNRDGATSPEAYKLSSASTRDWSGRTGSPNTNTAPMDRGNSLSPQIPKP